MLIMKYILKESQFNRIKRRSAELDSWIEVCLGEHCDCVPWKGSSWCRKSEEYYINGMINYFISEMLIHIDPDDDSEEIPAIREFIRTYILQKWYKSFINAYEKGCK